MSQFDKKLLKKIIEGLLLASNDPLTVKRIAEIFSEHSDLGDTPVDTVQPDADEIQAALDDIQADCRDHGYELKEVSSGWRFQVKQELSGWIGRLWEEKPAKYSRAILETLALIAYRQPITRGDIEEIRGVAVSTTIVKTLMERQWVRIVGHRDVPGRPALYATTRQFLDYFNLKSLDELPSLGELRDIDKINAELDFEQDQQMAEILAPKLAEQAGGDIADEVTSDADEASIDPEVTDDGDMAAYAVQPEEISDSDIVDVNIVDATTVDATTLHEQAITDA